MKTQKVHQEKVVRTIQPKRGNNGTLQFEDNRPKSFIQRMADATLQRESEEEDTLQGKFAETAQREEDEEESLQMKPNNTGLPDHLKSGVENLSGYSLNDVRVHYNSPKPAQLQALAYTQGTDIHVAPGQEQHLPHEAWHVVQQMQGRVQPTMQLQGVNINDNAGLEHEADVMGGKAVVQRKTMNNTIQVQDNNGKCIQGYFGNPTSTVICNAKIHYNFIKNKNRHQQDTMIGSGGSDAGTIAKVFDVFEKFSLHSLATITQAGGGNPPGQCAEPHAIADALKDILKLKKRCKITSISVDDAWVNHPTLGMTRAGKIRGTIMPRCATCLQWVPGNDVLPQYLS